MTEISRTILQKRMDLEGKSRQEYNEILREEISAAVKRTDQIYHQQQQEQKGESDD